MVTLSLVVIAAVSTVGAYAGTFTKKQDDFLTHIDKQYEISVRGVLDNIGPNGSKAPGVPAGVMIASPSTQDPDCKFTHAHPLSVLQS